MSLNGLDDVKVKEAHDVAIAELGGWFLLKYSSRDEVELLGRGNGGIVEIRNAIAQYEEESPLFGFLRYRRRNVLIKYVPEGCSRLVQVRATVHFNAVTERFSPYDTIFSIGSSKELRDSTLSAACSLHTASGSTSSSTSSLRRRRLMEIAEDANEDKRQSTLLEERPPTAKEPSVAGSQNQPSAALPTLQSPELESSASYLRLISDAEALGPSDKWPRSPAKSLDGRRKSTQSTRPEISRYNSFGSNGRHRVKLGPRPSLDVGGRPQTSSSFGSYRPVSTLPPGLKLFSKSSKRLKGIAQSQYPNPPPTMTLSPPPIPGTDSSTLQTTTLIRPHTSGGRPTTSSGASMKSPMSPHTAIPKSPAMTPEKLRLMKALQLRKKQMSAVPQVELIPPPAPDIKGVPPVSEDEVSQDASKDRENVLAKSNDMARSDSAISIEAPSVVKVATSDPMRTNSTPDSPTEPSDEAESTQASSVSESTDETVRETHDDQKIDVAKHSEPVNRPISEKARQDSEENAIKSLKIHMARDIEERAADIRSPDAGDNDPQKTNLPMVLEDMQKADKLLENSIDAGSRSNALEGEDAPIDKHGEELTSHGEEQSVPILKSKENDLKTSKSQFAVIESATPKPFSVLQKPGQANIAAPQDDAEQRLSAKESIETAPAAQSPRRELKIPRSKFSVQDPTESEIIMSGHVDVPSGDFSSNLPKSPLGSTFSNDTKRSLTEDEKDAGLGMQARKKRGGHIDPIRTDISAADRSGHNSEAELLSDDDLMDELQSATVQEAKPISVSKSPIGPFFSNQVSKPPIEANRFSRSFSNPLGKETPKGKMLSPQDPVGEASRSVSASAAYLNRINQQQTLPTVKKVNLGSGISQRIKALEKLSSSTTSPTTLPGTTGPTPGSSPSFFSIRSRRGSKSPSIVERGASLTRKMPSPTVSRDSSPETLKLRDRSGSVQSRKEAFNSPPASQPQRSRPESISVTARIVRDPSHPFPQKPEMSKDPLDFPPLDLHQSPLVIDHQKAIVTPPPPNKETIQERRLSNPQKEVKKERRSSITIVRDLINETRSSFAERRKSMSIERPIPSPARSSSRPPSAHTNSPNTTRPLSVSSRRSSISRDPSSSFLPPGAPSGLAPPVTFEENPDKKSGRASRMLRLMSASLSASRKSLAHAISPTVREELEPPNTNDLSATESPLSQYSVAATVTVEMGDVNVQFPDTLLWKRRSMSLDSHGFLLLSQAQGSKGTEKGTSVKKYHLSTFRTPFMPEMELQELPNSVVLDFVEGGGLQIACEDRGGQLRALDILLEAHRSYAAYGQGQ